MALLVMYQIGMNIVFIFTFLSSSNFPKQGTKKHEPERKKKKNGNWIKSVCSKDNSKWMKRKQQDRRRYLLQMLQFSYPEYIKEL